MPSDDTQVTYPLGARYRTDAADRNVFTPSGFTVLGQVEFVPAGNTILRIGETLSNTDHRWCQTMHLVLTAAERDQLIADLLAQRDNPPNDPR